jgi:hypothetical protein
MQIDIKGATIFMGGRPILDTDVGIVNVQNAEGSRLFDMLFTFADDKGVTQFVRTPFQMAMLSIGEVMVGMN